MKQSLSRQIKRGHVVIVRDLATGGVRFEKPSPANRKNSLSHEEHEQYRNSVYERARLDTYVDFDADGLFSYTNRVYVKYQKH